MPVDGGDVCVLLSSLFVEDDDHDLPRRQQHEVMSLGGGHIASMNLNHLISL